MKLRFLVRNRWIKNIVLFLFGFALTLGLVELGLRIAGYHAYEMADYTVSYKPESPYKGNAKYGISLKQGKYSVTINNELNYVATHNRHGERISSKEIMSDMNYYFTGCSFTYGQGVDDSCTYLFQLSEVADSINIHNISVPSYGNLQGLLQLKELIKNKVDIDLFVVNYLPFHDHRNSLDETYRKQLYDGIMISKSNEAAEQFNLDNVKYPWAEMINGKLVVRHDDVNAIYQSTPFNETFALSNLIQNAFNNRKVSSANAVKVTKGIFDEINRIAKKENIDLCVTLMMDDPVSSKLKTYLENQKINVITFGMDFGNSEYTNAPIDPHPNANAHSIMFEKLYSNLHQLGYLQ